MKTEFLLEQGSFRLALGFEMFASDIAYPANTILSVSVLSDGFSACTTMDIDSKNLPVFCDRLKAIYDSLEGEAKLQETYGERQYIAFSADGRGHIAVSGRLSSNGRDGFRQELQFENSVDQTVLADSLGKLSEFVYKLKQ